MASDKVRDQEARKVAHELGMGRWETVASSMRSERSFLLKYTFQKQVETLATELARPHIDDEEFASVDRKCGVTSHEENWTECDHGERKGKIRITIIKDMSKSQRRQLRRS